MHIERGRRTRPLRWGPDLEETVRRQLAVFAPLYEESDVAVRTDLAREEQVVDEIVKLLRYPKRRGKIAAEVVTVTPTMPVS